ncbi:MAG: YetF domain-containing protein [Oscillospiraceae bacterium]
MEDIWNSSQELSILGFALRTLIVGAMLYIASRFLPHRSGGQYAGFDFTFFWMMGGLIASPLFDSKISFTNTITAAVTIYLMHYLIAFIAVKSRGFAGIVFGKAEILVSKGQIQRKNMLKSLFPIELLLSQLREINVPNIAEVDTAILETSGRVSVLKRADHAPVTSADLNITTAGGGIPKVLVNDGKIIDKNLEAIGYDRTWLTGQLNKHGAMDIKDVYLATIDGAGKVYCSLRGRKGR